MQYAKETTIAGSNNKMHIVHFDSVYALVQEIQSTRDKYGRYIKLSHGDSLEVTTDTDWVLATTMGEWIDILSGVPEYPIVDDALDNMQRLQKAIQVDWQTPLRKRQKRYSNTGAKLHRQRLYTGHAHNAFSVRKRVDVQDRAGIVTIIVPLGAPSCAKGERLQHTAFCAYALAYALEQSGKHVEVYGISCAEGVLENARADVFMVATKVVSAQRATSILNFIPLCFPDYLRRSVFRIRELWTTGHKTQLFDGYGISILDFSPSNRGFSVLRLWANHAGIDTDNMLVTPSVNSIHIESPQNIRNWVQETVNAING